jgi:glutamine synthetase
LAAGLDGIENKIQPSPPTNKNIFRMTKEEREKEGIASLPANLQEAINEMEKSALMRELLGEHIFTKYIEAKKKEWDDYRTKITPWEIEHYLTKY